MLQAVGEEDAFGAGGGFEQDVQLQMVLEADARNAVNQNGAARAD